jgi:hypothetical protein
LKTETDIPSEIRRSIDGEAARRVEVIRSEVTTCVRKCADEDRARKNQHQKTVSREAMFCFHVRYCSTLNSVLASRLRLKHLKIFQPPHFGTEITPNALVAGSRV